jgi:hypothetical protein
MKKFGAILLAIAMILSVCSAWADGLTVTLGQDQSTDGNVVKEAFDVAITDGFTPITAVNFKSTLTSQGDYNSVGAKFIYTVSAGTASSVSSTDPAKTYQIYAGNVNAIDTATSTLTAVHPINASTGTAVPSTQMMTINFKDINTTNFPQTGIYRYKVTQTALTEAQIAADIKAIKDGTGTQVTDAVDKYLDVYVVTNDTDGDGAVDTAKIYGVVLFESTGDPTTVDTSKIDENGKVYAQYTTSNAQKTDTFDNIYTAYKIKLEKKVKGAAASATDKFPFSLIVTDPETDTDESVILAGVQYGYDASSAGSTTAIAYNATTGQIKIGDDVTSIKLKKDETIEIVGLPASALVKIKETISALLGYDITSEITNFDGTTVAITTPVTTDENGTSGAVAKSEDGVITYTNTREQISPTGVILRVAPYALILVAGLALLLISRHRKAATIEE